MPHPFAGIAALVALYAFCLLFSFSVCIVYGKREKQKVENDGETVFRIQAPRRRRRRSKQNAITIRGRIINDDDVQNLSKSDEVIVNRR